MDSIRSRELIPALLCLALLLPVAAEARIKRSQSAKVEFKHEHPCPASGARKGPCKGYVIDPYPAPCGQLHYCKYFYTC